MVLINIKKWARDLFEGIFKTPAENVNMYLTQPTFVESILKQTGNHKEIFESINSFLVAAKSVSFAMCVELARIKFEDLFSSTIKQLLYNFPVDSLTSTGTPFWSGPKRAPDIMNFDASNSLHLDFVMYGANLNAFNFGIEGMNPS